MFPAEQRLGRAGEPWGVEKASGGDGAQVPCAGPGRWWQECGLCLEGDGAPQGCSTSIPVATFPYPPTLATESQSVEFLAGLSKQLEAEQGPCYFCLRDPGSSSGRGASERQIPCSELPDLGAGLGPARSPHAASQNFWGSLPPSWPT